MHRRHCPPTLSDSVLPEAGGWRAESCGSWPVLHSVWGGKAWSTLISWSPAISTVTCLVLMQLCHRVMNRFVTCVKVEEFFCQVKILTQCQRENELQVFSSYLPNMSDRMSRASSWTDTSSCFPMAPISWDVIFLQTLAVRVRPGNRQHKETVQSHTDTHWLIIILFHHSTHGGVRLLLPSSAVRNIKVQNSVHMSNCDWIKLTVTKPEVAEVHSANANKMLESQWLKPDQHWI